MDKFERTVQVAEVIGAAAVVISLIYVGSEIRQNTLAIQDGGHRDSVAMGFELEQYLWDPIFSEVYDEGLQDYAMLDGPQKRQFDSFVSQNFNIWEYAFYGRDRGTMSTEIWNGWDRWFRSQLAQESWRRVWAQRREGYGESFQQYADSVAGRDR